MKLAIYLVGLLAALYGLAIGGICVHSATQSFHLRHRTGNPFSANRRRLVLSDLTVPPLVVAAAPCLVIAYWHPTLGSLGWVCLGAASLAHIPRPFCPLGRAHLYLRVLSHLHYLFIAFACTVIAMLV